MISKSSRNNCLKLLLTFTLPAFCSPAVGANVEVVCAYAPSQSKAVAAISGAGGGAAATLSAVGAATGLTVVSHSSGAAILTGSSGYIAGTLGASAAVPIIFSVGLAVGASAATVELVCAGKNHPDQVANVQKAAAEFRRRFAEAMRDTKVAVGERINVIVPATTGVVLQVKQVSMDIWQYVYRK